MFRERLSFPWFATVCAEIIILSNILHIELKHLGNKSVEYDIVFTGKFPFPWIFSVLISSLLIALSSRYSGIFFKSFSFLRGVFKWIHVFLFFLSLFALTYAALSFLDKDIYSTGNYKWALFALGLSQISISLIDLISFLPAHQKMKAYIAQLFKISRLEIISSQWGFRIGIGILMICISQGYQNIPGNLSTLDLVIALSIVYLFIMDLDLSIRSSKIENDTPILEG